MSAHIGPMNDDALRDLVAKAERRQAPERNLRLPWLSAEQAEQLGLASTETLAEQWNVSSSTMRRRLTLPGAPAPVARMDTRTRGPRRLLFRVEEVTAFHERGFASPYAAPEQQREPVLPLDRQPEQDQRPGHAPAETQHRRRLDPAPERYVRVVGLRAPSAGRPYVWRDPSRASLPHKRRGAA